MQIPKQELTEMLYAVYIYIYYIGPIIFLV